MDVSALTAAVLLAEEIDPEGNQAIGWTAGIFTIGLFIVVGLLLWSFVRMARRAREPWENERTDEDSDLPRDDETP